MGGDSVGALSGDDQARVGPFTGVAAVPASDAQLITGSKYCFIFLLKFISPHIFISSQDDTFSLAIFNIPCFQLTTPTY